MNSVTSLEALTRLYSIQGDDYAALETLERIFELSSGESLAACTPRVVDACLRLGERHKARATMQVCSVSSLQSPRPKTKRWPSDDPMSTRSTLRRDMPSKGNPRASPTAVPSKAPAKRSSRLSIATPSAKAGPRRVRVVPETIAHQACQRVTTAPRGCRTGKRSETPRARALHDRSGSIHVSGGEHGLPFGGRVNGGGAKKSDGQ